MALTALVASVAPAAEPPATAPATTPAVDSESAVVGVPVWHEQLLVTATRTALEAGEVPLHATVLDGAEIAAAPDSGTLDLLRSVPSLNLSREVGTLAAQPRDQAVSMRGLVGSVQSRALPLVDGVPIVDPFGGWVTLSLAPKELLDRVEIVRGGGSSAWGNLALSGVVNLITRAPSPQELGFAARVAERSTSELTASYADLGRRVSGWIAGSHFETDGYITIDPSVRGAADEPNFRRWEAMHGRLGLSSSPATTWTGRAVYYDERRGLGAVTDRADQRELAVSLALDHQRTGAALWQAKLFHRDLDGNETAGTVSLDRSTITPETAIVDQPSRSTGVSLLRSATFGRHAWTLGGDAVANRIEQRQLVGWDGSRYTGSYDVRGEQRFAGLFVQDRWTVGARTSVQLGARVDRVWSGEATSVRRALPGGATIGSDPIDDQTETAFNPSLGVVFAANESTRLRGAVYTGFRVGTPVERFVGSASTGRSATAPNPELEPERLVGVEAGFDWTPSRRAALRATLFLNEVEDLIQRIVVGSVGSAGGFLAPCGELQPRARCLQYRNVGKIRSTGIELAAEHRPSDHWRLSLAATLLRSQIVANASDPSLEDNRVERAPDQQITAGVTWLGGGLGDLTLRGRYVGVAYDDAENTERLPSHTLVDLGWSRQLASSWELYAGVENLLDERHVSRYTSTGFHFNSPRLGFVGLRFRSGGGR